jgi:hypothetical protein
VRIFSYGVVVSFGVEDSGLKRGRRGEGGIVSLSLCVCVCVCIRERGGPLLLTRVGLMSAEPS